MKLKLRTIGDFPDDPRQFNRAAAQLEANVADAFNQAEVLFSQILRPTPRKSAAYAAVVGELVDTDTSVAGFTVTLPDATALNKGETVAIVRRSAANTLLARAPTTNVQGQTPNTGDTVPATVGLYEYMSTGTDWWRR